MRRFLIRNWRVGWALSSHTTSKHHTIRIKLSGYHPKAMAELKSMSVKTKILILIGHGRPSLADQSPKFDGSIKTL